MRLRGACRKHAALLVAVLSALRSLEPWRQNFDHHHGAEARQIGELALVEAPVVALVVALVMALVVALAVALVVMLVGSLAVDHFEVSSVGRHPHGQAP